MFSHHSKRKVAKRSVMYSAVEGTLVSPSVQPSLADYEPDFTKVVLLLHGDGANGNQTFTDSSTLNKTVTVVGNAQNSTTQSKYGTASLYFDGTGDYSLLDGSSDFAFGTGDFTIEMWVYRTVAGANQIMYDSRPSGTNGAYPMFYISSADKLIWYTNTAVQLTGTTSLSANTWHHVAASRISGITRMFLNGVQEAGNYTDANSYLNGASRPCIGCEGATLGSSSLTGYIDDLRVTKGVGRYSSTFTPPSKAYPNQTTPIPQDWYNSYWEETVLLLSMDYVGSTMVFQDNSKYRRNPMLAGNAVISNAQSKFGGWSGYFDGTGDYLTCDGSSNFTFGTGDFTVEMWVYVSNVTGTKYLIDFKNGGTANPLLYIGSATVRYYVNSADQITSSALVANTWYHVALSRVSGVTRLFLNGNQTGSSYTDANNYGVGAGRPSIGCNGTTLGNDPYAGYIDELRITKGVGRYVSGFVPPQASFAFKTLDDDTHFANVSLLLHADGANNANNATILDSSGLSKSITRVGDVAQGTFSPFPVAAGKQYNAADNIGSAYFDGTGDYLTLDGSSDFAFGTGDFTVEWWANPSVVSGTRYFFDFNTSGTANPIIYLSTTFRLHVSAADRITSSTNFVVGTWYHLALVRSSGVTKLYVNGTQQGASYTDTNNYTVGAARPSIGCNGTTLGNDPYNGFIANLNIIKGTAKYTSNFSVPPAPVTPHANTKLLLNFTNAAIFDHTGKNDVQVFGDSKTLVAVSKYGGSSMYLDGTGDTLNIVTNTAMTIGSNAFTIEGWFYLTNSGSVIKLFSFNAASAYGFVIERTASNFVSIACSTSGSSWAFIDAATTNALPVNQWFHFAVTRNAAGVISSWLDGTKIKDHATNASALYAGPNNRIGVYSDGTSQAMQGHIDDFRFTNGVCRYTGNFTPPAQAFPNK